MKSIKYYLLLVILIIISSCNKTGSDSLVEENSIAQSREFYQIKTYILNTEEQEQATDSYLKQAYLPGLKKIGVKHIGVFKPLLNAEDTLRKIIVLIPFSSMSQFITLEEELSKDKNYLASGKQYIDASYEQPPYVRIESILLKAFEDMPVMKASKLNGLRSNRVYELRSYESATESYFKNKVEMFNAGGEVKLFDQLGFNAVFFGEVISGAKMPNLMYLTTFSDKASRDAHWNTFSESPEWKEMSSMPKYQNNVSHADITFLFPTEYSDY